MHGAGWMATKDQETLLNKRLSEIHRRVQWIADEEQESTLVGGHAVTQIHSAEKKRLLEEAEGILEALRRADA
jgi:hypothetical protein